MCRRTRTWHISVKPPFYNVLFVLVKTGWLEPHKEDIFEHDALDVLSDMNPEYEAIIYYVPMLMGVDFSELLEHHLDYAKQPHIQKRRVWLMAACAVYYNLDFGLVL